MWEYEQAPGKAHWPRFHEMHTFPGIGMGLYGEARLPLRVANIELLTGRPCPWGCFVCGTAGASAQFLVGGQPQSSTCKGHEGCCSGKQCMQCAGRGQLYPMWWRYPGGYAGIHCRMLAILGPHVCVLRALPSAYTQACLSPFQDELLPLWLHRWRSRRPTSGETRSLAALSSFPLGWQALEEPPASQCSQ